MAHTQFQQPPSVIKGCRAPVATARPSRPAAHHPSPLSSTQATQCQATAHCLLQPGSWPRTGFHLVLGSPARCTCTSTGPSALPTRCRQHQAHRRVPCRSAAREQDRFGVLDSLDSLDSILGQQQATQTQEPQLTNAEVAFTKSEWKTLNKAGIYRLQDQVDVPRVSEAPAWSIHAVCTLQGAASQASQARIPLCWTQHPSSLTCITHPAPEASRCPSL